MLTINETLIPVNLPDKSDLLKLRCTKLTAEILLNRYPEKSLNDIFQDLEKVFSFDNITNETINNATKLFKETINDENKKILLITDYDADGISSAVIGERLLRLILPKNRFQVVVNKRKYGNGINHDLLKEIPNLKDFSLLITADHGSSNNEIFKELKKENKNLKIIVTDHHTFKDDNYPVDADYFINNQLLTQKNEKQWEELKDASGCLMLYVLLYHTLKDKLTLEDFAINAYPFLAITAISDVMSMYSPLNRFLVKSGLRVMNDNRSILFKTIKAYCLQEPLYTPDVIKYNLSPMINTGNRQHCEETTFRLLISDEPKEITDLLNEMISKNNDRKKMTNLITNAILKSDKLQGEYGKTIIVKTEMGINGIIASKIGEIKQLPTICFLDHGDILHGSARSILPNVDIIKILDRLNHDGLIVKYGGHREAAGCSVRVENIDEFRNKFDLYTKDEILSSDIDLNTINVFKKLDSSDIKINNIINLQNLEPTGKDFQDPLFYSELTINSCFSSESMSFLNFIEIDPTIKGVAFHNGRYDYKETFLKGNKIGIVFTMKLSYFKSMFQCNLNIVNASVIRS